MVPQWSRTGGSSAMGLPVQDLLASTGEGRMMRIQPPPSCVYFVLNRTRLGRSCGDVRLAQHKSCGHLAITAVRDTLAPHPAGEWANAAALPFTVVGQIPGPKQSQRGRRRFVNERWESR